MVRVGTKKRDPEDMLGQVLAWPDWLREGYDTDAEVPASLEGKRQIVCCAMGASAIGAGLVGDYARAQLAVPYEVVRDYSLPAYVSDETLVVCISFSGGTEETIAGYREARERGAAVLVVATGGELLKLARRDGVAAVELNHDGQPRAALPVYLGLLLGVFDTLGYIPKQATLVEKAAKRLGAQVAAAERRDTNVATELADALAGQIPFIYGSGLLAEAARRFKGQISENAKQTAAFENLPEQNHNALVGYEFPEELGDRASFVLLRSSFEHPRVSARFELMKDLLHKRHLPELELSAEGDDELSQLTSLLFWCDLASVHLAYLNGIDPTPVTVIEELKAKLRDA